MRRIVTDQNPRRSVASGKIRGYWYSGLFLLCVSRALRIVLVGHASDVSLSGDDRDLAFALLGLRREFQVEFVEPLARGVLRRGEADDIAISHMIEQQGQLIGGRVYVRARPWTTRMSHDRPRTSIVRNRVHCGFRHYSAAEVDRE